MRFSKYILINIIILSVFNSCSNRNKKQVNNDDVLSGNMKLRTEWELNRLVDPLTGKLPPNIAALELDFVKKITNDEQIKGYRAAMWTHRGPYLIGGRTRAFAIDVNDTNILLAGGVSGGIWRSINGGKNWTKVTLPDQLHSVSCIAQDIRKGKSNIWYYGTGEAYGNSAYASGAYFYGNGIYKSTDNGLSWHQLSSTNGNDITDFDPWDLIWNICTDPSNDTQDVVYSAALRRIYKSVDGGNSWELKLGGVYGSYFTDVAVSSKGVVYATMSSEGDKPGIFRSSDGNTFVNILPSDTFPKEFNRIVIGIDPNNSNIVYFLAHTPGYGKKTLRSQGEEDWNSLWKYHYLSGDGTGSGGYWENLNANIPSDGTRNFDNFSAQGGYNMAISVLPGNSKIIFIAGTNIYRSTDGFTSDSNIVQMGGYAVHTKRPNWSVYLNHHPDQHVIFYHPSNPKQLFNGNDGGIFKTYNCLDDTVKWVSLNNGYLTTQLYTAAIEENAKSDVIITGLQDNGNLFVNSKDPEAMWEIPYNADGSFGAIAKNKDFYIMSIQLGRIRKLKLDNNGKVLEFTRIDPMGAKDYMFINPLVLDPNNNNLLYVAEGSKVWRNDSVSYIPYISGYDSIKTGWKRFSDTVEFPNRSISALAVSTNNPANRLYAGTNKSVLYRIDNADKGDPELKRITSLTNAGNISCIAVDPRNADHVLVVFSNYKVYSLFYSSNGGTSWSRVAGNLEDNPDGSGNGPSLRWASILPLKNGKTLYFIGSSMGLFATDTLLETATNWVNIGAKTIGNVVIDMVKTRQTDGLVVVATHGNGVYSTYVNSVEELLGTKEEKIFMSEDVKVFPNPASNKVTVAIRQLSEQAVVSVYTMKGQCVFATVLQKSENPVYFNIDIKDFKTGLYFIQVNENGKKETITFIKS